MKDAVESAPDTRDDPSLSAQILSSAWGQWLKNRLGDFAAQAAAAAALVLVFMYLSFASPVFLTTNNLINIVQQTTVTAIIALGMTFVIITAGIDLSVGSTAAMAGVVGVKLIDNGFSWPLALLLATLAGGIVGLGNGLLVSVFKLNPFIATLGMMTVIRGITDVNTNAVVVAGPANILGPTAFGVLGLGRWYGIPVALLVLIVISAITYFLLSRTRLGRYTYAIGSNQEAARLSGIPVRNYLIAVYVLLGLLTGFAGMVAVSRLGSGQPDFGIGLELDVIAATVVGGASLFGGQGTIPGTLIGVFLIALIRNGSVLLDINSFWQEVIIGAVIWLAVFWDQFRRRRLSSIT
jgi:ribose transport system permease protein